MQPADGVRLVQILRVSIIQLQSRSGCWMLQTIPGNIACKSRAEPAGKNQLMKPTTALACPWPRSVTSYLLMMERGHSCPQRRGSRAQSNKSAERPFSEHAADRNVRAPLKHCVASVLLGLTLGAVAAVAEPATSAHGWLSWRGPQQNGTSLERNLPDSLVAKDALWVADFPGQSAPVIANGRLYIMGYLGEGADMQEGVACFDAETGKKLWQQLYNDFLSDTVYQRYATSSAAVDPETGNVYMEGTQGILAAFTADGAPLWRHSLMEEFGRLTFPNSRTASPLIDGQLVIIRRLTANWGAQRPAADRFYAFDKKTGELVWVSSPGD